MESKNLHYTINNQGDGSVVIHWFETEELAKWDEAHMEEGWGEDCASFITVSSESPIMCDELKSKENYLFDLLDGYNQEDEASEFAKKFFPDGVPNFDLFTSANRPDSRYDVIVDGFKVGEVFSYENGEVVLPNEAFATKKKAEWLEILNRIDVI